MAATLSKPTVGTIWEDGGATLMARVLGADGTTVAQADITSADFKVFDLTSATPGTTVSTGTLTINVVFFNALQTDARWTADSTGYNFRHTLPAATFPTGGHRYRVEYFFDPVTGEDFPIVYELYCQRLLRS